MDITYPLIKDLIDYGVKKGLIRLKVGEVEIFYGKPVEDLKDSFKEGSLYINDEKER